MVASRKQTKRPSDFSRSLRVIKGSAETTEPWTQAHAIGLMQRKTMLMTLDSLVGAGLTAVVALAMGISPSPTLAALVPALIAGLYVGGQYDEYHPTDLSSSVGVCTFLAVTLAAAGAGLSFLGTLPVDWRTPLIVGVVFTTGIVIWRLLFRMWVARSIHGEPVILIGQGKAFAEGWRIIRNAPHLQIENVVENPNPEAWVAAVEERLRKRLVRRVSVVIGFDAPLMDAQSATLVRLRRLGADIMTVSHLIELLEERIPIALTRGDSLEGWDRIQQAGNEVSLRVKRVVDIGGALVLGAILGLPALLCGVATRLSDGGAALYRQRRVGKDGHIFEIIKIRSMVIDAERQSGAVWSTEEDPRITRLGRFMRKTRLDEVPQLWNVIRGQMSLVGPRPERPEFTDRLVEEIPLYDSRHIVNPGLTGWAQIRLPYGASVDDSLAKLEYDLYYIRHWSLSFDIRILLRTIGIVLFRQGGR